MNMKVIKLSVGTGDVGAATLLIQAGSTVIRTEYSDLAACAFPVRSGAPIPVEIPPDGRKSFIVGPYSGLLAKIPSDGSFPNLVKLPVYRRQAIDTAAALSGALDPPNSPSLAKVPLVALASTVAGELDGRIIQSSSVLPIWHDGSSVLVNLDWFEGEPSEGLSTPEWHLHASTGLPAEVGTDRMLKVSCLPHHAQNCQYRLYFTPWMLAAALLGDEGRKSHYDIWGREWLFNESRAFFRALRRVADGLLRPDPRAEFHAVGLCSLKKEE